MHSFSREARRRQRLVPGVDGETRVIAFPLAGFTLLAALIFRPNFSDQMQMLMFLENVSMTAPLGEVEQTKRAIPAEDEE
jgi:hypothetical protein